jgi:Zn-finger domain-containing protein
VPPAADGAVTDPRLQDVQDAMQRLEKIHGDFMARLDAMQHPEEQEDSKTLLEMLVDTLEEFVTQKPEKLEKDQKDPS